MEGARLRSIVIVGGGAVGWMAAAALTRLVDRAYCRVAVVERPAAHPFGAAEGTIPALRRFHNLLGIDEDDLLRRTNATFKLGIEFAGWTPQGGSFFHTFCEFGGTIAQVPFHHHWLRLREHGDETEIDAYSLATQAATLGRFAPTSPDNTSPLSLHSYAYHLDGDPYAAYLRDFAVSRGAERIAAKAVGAELRGSDGFIEAVVLDDNRRIEADFFIDCTGFPGLLMEQAFETGYEDWTRWLPCDRAAAAPSPRTGDVPVHTTVTADDAGWRWSMPLRDRCEGGTVYSSAFAKGDDPGAHRFLNGRPRKFWNRNCLALPGGLVEPLEATALHLVQTGILRFIGTFPDRTHDRADSDEYNRLAAIELERIRDFLILHYRTCGRDDTPFWRHCSAMPVPDAVAHKIALFRGTGRVNMLDDEHFGAQSWVSLFLGHGIVPQSHDPLAELVSLDELRRHLARMAETIRTAARSMPRHRDSLAAVP